MYIDMNPAITSIMNANGINGSVSRPISKKSPLSGFIDVVFLTMSLTDCKALLIPLKSITVISVSREIAIM